MHPLRFAVIPLGYMPLSVLASLKGAPYSFGVFLAILAVHLAWDALRPVAADPRGGRKAWAFDALLYLQVPLSLAALSALAHIAGTYAGVVPGRPAWMAGLGLPETYSFLDLAGAAVALGFQLAANDIVAHELMHRKGAVPVQTARFLLAMVGDAQFHLAHLYNHHSWVGTPRDASTARRGESVYRFFLRSTWGQYRASWNFEAGRKSGAARWNLFRNRVLSGLLITGLIAAASYAYGGGAALLAYLAVCVYAKFLLETVNYIQHYGLVRLPSTPVQPRHSWDCATESATATFYNLTRHSDHHANGRLPYWLLRNHEGTLKLGKGYVHAMLIACLPPVWYRWTAPSLERWDRELATPDERALAGHRAEPVLAAR